MVSDLRSVTLSDHPKRVVDRVKWRNGEEDNVVIHFGSPMGRKVVYKIA